ncbi:cytochrome c oxidase subunit 3 [Alcanivorax marinus]|uniref:cytochrome-c oxidase n=1 Tax=Alloalcanivorax marinus TaxID=1177169 RepID=A0A9Q3YMX7_9GAMM|nr:cytochrome c oxidase subunit 3 [Alloalcanivorax marinus]MCC4307305.1 cytochrome c oxidase subunit 3 [Alloalcanivorax marinus]MCH2558202.1 cytochrome c oxidase subunit 3 [Alcanivorax sp.]
MATEKYYVPESSPWPLAASVGLFMTAVGGAHFIQQSTAPDKFEGSWGMPLFFFGLATLWLVIAIWWRDTIKESVGGLHSKQLGISYRQGMLWFIFSEVMFFGAFFGALFYTRWLIVPWLGGAGSNAMTHELLWPNFQAMWPLIKTPDGTTTQAMGAWGLPAINTAILLTSSVTLTIAHHALLEGKRGRLIGFQAATVLLGAIFLGLQAWEYHHAYVEMGLTLHAGIYGSLFFLLTGFHGAHVTIGTIFLFVTLLRVIKGHFDAENNFAWEAGAWYWHFVDVVWLFLFVVVYWL